MVIQLTSPNLVYIVFRHRIAMAAIFFSISLAAIAYCLVATPRYEGDVSLVVTFSQLHSGTPGDTQSQNASGAPEDRQEIINSYLLELQGADLAREVIETIGLPQLYPSIVRPPNPLDPRAWLTMLFPPNPEELRRARMERAVYRFTHSDLIVETGRDSNVIHISLLNPSRELAQQAVEVFVNKFLEREAAIGRNPRLEFVNGQVDFYHKKVTEAQAAIEKFRTDNSITSLDDEMSALLQQRTIQEQALATIQTRIIEDQRKSVAYRGKLATLAPVISVTTGTLDPLVQSARESLGTLVSTEGKLRQIYSAKSPAVADVQSQIDQMERIIDLKVPKSQLSSTLPNPTYQEVEAAQIQAQADLDAAQQSKSELSSQLDAINSRMQNLNREMGEYQNLTREYQLADQNYRLYLQGVQEARIDNDLNKQRITSISVFDSAYAPLKPTRPRSMLIIVGAMLFGALGAFALACLREQLDERLNLPEQIEGALDLPLIGSMGVLQKATKA